MTSSRKLPVSIACGWVFALVLCGCDSGRGGPVLTKENFEKITVGMTESQVTAVLGKPTESMDLALPDPLASLGGKLPEGVELPKNGKRSVWRDGGRGIPGSFASGKVA